MRRAMLIALALIIVMIGAGIFILTTTVLAQPVQANTTLPTTNTTTLTTSQPTMSDAVQAIPASSVPYGADAESEITLTAPKMEGHHCESGY